MYVLRMQVTAEETYIAPSEQRRGRICRREDGYFQVVTETLRDATDEHDAYWTPDYPPSGLFALREEARVHLAAVIPEAAALSDIQPCTFDMEVGPYPEPVLRISG